MNSGVRRFAAFKLHNVLVVHPFDGRDEHPRLFGIDDEHIAAQAEPVREMTVERILRLFVRHDSD